MEKFLAFIGRTVCTFALMAYGIIVGAFAFSTLWGWFIVPVFELPVLSMVQAAGIGTVLMYFSLGQGMVLDEIKQKTVKEQNWSGRMWEGIFDSTYIAAASLAIGRVILALT